VSLPDFASIEQQCDKRLRGWPVGIVPFAGTDRTAIIACPKEDKAYRVKNNMQIRETNALCSGLFLAPSKPDMYLYLRINTKIAIYKI